MGAAKERKTKARRSGAFYNITGEKIVFRGRNRNYGREKLPSHPNWKDFMLWTSFTMEINDLPSTAGCNKSLRSDQNISCQKGKKFTKTTEPSNKSVVTIR
ncbi:uncharacterized protein [Euwallacea fornicatus]|uniref:uncharacterized protein isoform X2 n=1 Tax=Euwallacea fornicatus TaxID=995702 RepID=UPI00338EF085